MVFAVILGLILIVAGLVTRRRLSTYIEEPARLTDAQIRQLEIRGYVDVDEPMDLSDIQDEETRFWEESPWEDPDESV